MIQKYKLTNLLTKRWLITWYFVVLGSSDRPPRALRCCPNHHFHHHSSSSSATLGWPWPWPSSSSTSSASRRACVVLHFCSGRVRRKDGSPEAVVSVAFLLVDDGLSHLFIERKIHRALTIWRSGVQVGHAALSFAPWDKQRLNMNFWVYNLSLALPPIAFKNSWSIP